MLKNNSLIWRWTLAAMLGIVAPAMAAQSVNYSAPPGMFSNGMNADTSANYQLSGVLGNIDQTNTNSAQYQAGQAVLAMLPTTLSVTLNTLAFGSADTGTASAAQSITLSNTGSNPATLGSINISSNFAQVNDCGSSLASGASCTINIMFMPAAAGVLNGSLSISSNALPATQKVSLSGTGIAVAVQPALALAQSWNLLGNSVETPLNVASTFGDPTQVTSVWKWLPVTRKWAFYSPSMTLDELATYAASKGYVVLTTIEGGEGFWVNALTSFNTTLASGVAVTTHSLKDQPDPSLNKLATGWNLVAVGDNVTPRAFNELLSLTQPAANTIPQNIISLWAWDSAQAKWYFYSPQLEANGTLQSYTTHKNFLDFGTKTLDAASGFWVNKVLSNFNHAGIAAGTCTTCHNTKPATHTGVRATLSCDSCHTTTAWLPASYNHAGVAAGTCAS